MRNLLVSLLFAFAAAVPVHASVLRTIGEINRFLEGDGELAAYDVRGIVLSDKPDGILIIEDKTGRMFVSRNNLAVRAVPGDILRLCGKAFICATAEPWVKVDTAEVMGKGTPPSPVDIALSDLDGRRDNLRTVRVTGSVMDICADEIDPRYQIIFLKDGETVMPVSCACDRRSLPENIVNAKVRLTGRYLRFVSGLRKFSGATIHMDASIPLEIVEPAPQDPFSVPELEKLIYLTPKSIASLGRRSVRGQVLAVWNDSRLMVREANGRIVNVELANDAVRPRYGDSGVFVGYPTTDLYRINLARARFRPETLPTVPEEPPEVTTAAHLISHNWWTGNEVYHGRLLRLTGLVRSLPGESSAERRMLLTNGPHTVPVDISAHPASAELPAVGCEIAVTGRCILELDNWRTEGDFPQIRGFVLVTRSPGDIHVLRAPQWWTPRRLLAVIGVLLTGLVGFLLWNLTLRMLVQKRTRQALRAELDNARSELRVQERTHLAVELHDALSQNLTGIAFELKAAMLAFKRGKGDVFERLASAEKSLHSCRNELKNCLWDLRNDVIGRGDMAEAIRRAVQPHLGTAELRVRLRTPRACISDNMAHAILRIIRELVTNAVRHGAASRIRIAGSHDRGFVRFSVRDNGTGFNPRLSPGMSEGHFGLHGIRERLAAQNGTLDIKSRIGHGTRATITIAVPDDETSTDVK